MTMVAIHPVRRPRRNPLGLAAFIVAIVGFALNVIAGLLLFGWLVAPVGGILGMVAWVGARGRSWVLAVAALIATLASVFAVVAMYRDVVAPYLPA